MATSNKNLHLPRFIFIVSGVPGSGKTSTAAELLKRFPFGVHIPTDDIREMVISGIAQPVPVWTEETQRQYYLARNAAAQMAHVYADAGFIVVIDDMIFPTEAERIYAKILANHHLYKIILMPKIDVALMRNRQRPKKYFNSELLNDTIRELDESLRKQLLGNHGWFVLDNSTLSVEETVDTILNWCLTS